MDILAMAMGVMELCDIWGRFYGKKKDTQKQMESIRGHLREIKDVLQKYQTPCEAETSTNEFAYAATVYSPSFCAMETQIAEVRELLTDATDKTVILEDQQRLRQLCETAADDLASVWANATEVDIDDEALQRMAALLDSNPALQELPQNFRESFTISPKAGSLALRNANFVAVAHCDHPGCGRAISQRAIDQSQAIQRKGKTYCMNCICEKQAGDFPTLAKYRILHRLGKGGMADVYLAVQTNMYRLVAFKWLKDMHNPSEAKIRQVRRECKIGGNLHHPNIVQFFEADRDVSHPNGKTVEVYYVISEYIHGKTLDQALQETGPIPHEKLKLWSLQLLEALEFARCKGVVHRDLKPANIFITDDNYIKLGDFGLAKFFDATDLSSVKTRSGMSMGTLPFMAPEQFEQANTADHRSDIYSFGATLYQLLTGQYAFTTHACSAVQYMHKVLHDAPVPPSQLVPEIPEEWDQVILKCLKKKPEERYQQASEIMADIQMIW